MRLNGNALNDGDTFTQRDVVEGRISYKHSGTLTDTDGFEFSVNDGAISSSGHTFIFDVVLDEETPAPGEVEFYSFDEVRAGGVSIVHEDITTAKEDLVYTVTESTINGDITLNGSLLQAGDTFTQVDVEAGRLQYNKTDVYARDDRLAFTLEDTNTGDILASDSLAMKLVKSWENPFNGVSGDANSLANYQLTQLLDITERWNEITNNTRLRQEADATGAALENGHNWGGLDENHYRGDTYSGRSREQGLDTNTDHIFNVDNSMTATEIQAVIDAAPAHSTIVFKAGDYDLDRGFKISRDDLTVRGETDTNGDSLVTLHAYDTATQAGETHYSVFQLKQENFNPQWAGWEGNSNPSLKLSTQTNGIVHAEDTVIALQDVTNVEAGDMLVLHHGNDANFNSRTNLDRLQIVAEIESVNFDTNEVTLVDKIGMDYDPNRASSTNQALVIDDEGLIKDVILKDFNIQYYNDAEYDALVHDRLHSNRDYNVDNTAAISVTGAYEIDIENITGTHIASRLMDLAGVYKGFVNDITIDGSINNGGGGNGYGILFNSVFHSDFENIKTTDDAPLRHTFVFSYAASDAFNNVHIAHSSANMDFHGGSQFGNIVYIESLDYYEKADYNIKGLEFRYDQDFGVPLNEIQNTVVMGDYEGAKYLNPIPGYTPPSSNNDVVSYGSPDTIYAQANGSVIKANSENDTIHSGSGDDIIELGTAADAVIFYNNSGHDMILDFNANDTDWGHRGLGDMIGVISDVNDSGIETSQDLLDRATQNGADTVIDLGDDNMITLSDFYAGNLTAANFFVIG